MSKSLYLECGSGISGDMTVAALRRPGSRPGSTGEITGKPETAGYEIAITRVKKSGLDACDFNVILDAEHENHDHDMAYLHGMGRKCMTIHMITSIIMTTSMRTAMTTITQGASSPS